VGPHTADGAVGAAFREGTPHRLVGSNAQGGSDLGLWCIESLDETDTEFTEDGIPLAINGTLKISEWGEDEF